MLEPKGSLLEISFDFRTFEASGLLLKHQMKAGYLAVFLDNARLKVTLVNAKESLTLDSFDLAYDDGLWHSFNLALSSFKINFTIDSEIITRYTKSGFRSTSEFLIGGDGQNSAGFVGCLKNLRLWNKPIFLGSKDVKITGKVVENVCHLDDKCLPNPCQNGGICKQTSAEFHCECEGTGYAGALCHTSLNYRSCYDFSLANPTVRFVDDLLFSVFLRHLFWYFRISPLIFRKRQIFSFLPRLPVVYKTDVKIQIRISTTFMSFDENSKIVGFQYSYFQVRRNINRY